MASVESYLIPHLSSIQYHPGVCLHQNLQMWLPACEQQVPVIVIQSYEGHSSGCHVLAEPGAPQDGPDTCPRPLDRRYHITTGMQAGMIVSNEPGYYEDGGFGIRIENLLIARKADTPFTFGGLPYVSFERLTLVPMQRKLMELQVPPW